MGMAKHSKVPKTAGLEHLYNNLKKMLEMKLIFCMQINIKVSYKLILTFEHQSNLQGDTIITDGGMIKYSQNTQYNKLAIALQYLTN